MTSTKRREALREEMELHLAEKAAELHVGGMTLERARLRRAADLATPD